MRHFSKIFVCVAVLHVLALSCSYMEHAPSLSAGADSQVLRAALSIRRGGGISNFCTSINVFIYNEDGRLETFYDADPSQSYLDLVSCSGRKWAVITANLDASKLLFEKISTHNAICGLPLDFAEEDPLHPVMFAELEYSTFHNETPSIIMKPVLTRIAISAFSYNFGTTPYSNARMENIKAYIINSYGQCPLAGHSKGAWLINEGEYDYYAHSLMKHPQMLFSNDITSAEFLCYAAPETRLVIQAEIEGNTYFYAMPLENDGEKIQRGVSYEYDIHISGKGTLSPRVDADAGVMNVRLTGRKWDEKQQQNEEF